MKTRYKAVVVTHSDPKLGETVQRLLFAFGYEWRGLVGAPNGKEINWLDSAAFLADHTEMRIYRITRPTGLAHCADSPQFDGRTQLPELVKQLVTPRETVVMVGSLAVGAECSEAFRAIISKDSAKVGCQTITRENLERIHAAMTSKLLSSATESYAAGIVSLCRVGGKFFSRSQVASLLDEMNKL